MKKLLLLYFFFLSPFAYSQQLVVNTTRFVGSNTSCWLQTNCAITAKDGGIVFAGSTNCFSGGGDIPASPADGAGGEGNMLVGKLDSSMQISWIKVYGGSQTDGAVSMVQTTDGGYAVLGYTASNNGDVTGNHGAGDAWLVRLDASGNLLWQKCYGSAYDEQPVSIAETAGGGFILLSVSNGAGGDVPSHYSGSQFDYDWFIVKTDNSGTVQWTKSIGGSGDENADGSILSAENSYYLVSSSNSSDHDCTDSIWHPGVHTSNDYYVFKLDTSGKTLWDSSYGSISGEVAYQAIWDSRDSSIVINGVTTGNNYMVAGNHGGSDMWVVKINDKGVLKWQTCLGGVKDEQGASIALGADGYIVFGNTVPGNIGQEDGWLFAIDNNGSQITDKQIGGTSYENIAAVVPFKRGLMAVGVSASLGFSEGINSGNLPNPSSSSFFCFLKYFPLSILNSFDNLQLTVYPNPTRKEMRIMEKNMENGEISIFSTVGERVYKAETTLNEELIIDVSSWANGLYVVKWQGVSGGGLIRKFIKD